MSAKDGSDGFEFHCELTQTLRSMEPDTWNRLQQREKTELRYGWLKNEALKTASAILRNDAPEMYRGIDLACERLGVEEQVTASRVEGIETPSCQVIRVSDRIDLVLTGDVEELLNSNEFLALVGRQLGQVHLWQAQDGGVWVAEQILSTTCQEPNASESWHETLRLHHLYSEIYCDRWAYRAAEDFHAVVASIQKLSLDDALCEPATILDKVNKALGLAGSEATSDMALPDIPELPDIQIRALAIDWWYRGSEGFDEQLVDLVEGREDLSGLSLLKQGHWQRWTRDALVHLLKPAWRRTRLTLNHAGLFYSGNDLPESAQQSVESLDRQIRSASESMREYACYLLLDFSMCDSQIKEVALAQALEWAQRWGCESLFQEIARRELRLRKSQVDALLNEAATILAEAERHSLDPANSESKK